MNEQQEIMDLWWQIYRLLQLLDLCVDKKNITKEDMEKIEDSATLRVLKKFPLYHQDVRSLLKIMGMYDATSKSGLDKDERRIQEILIEAERQFKTRDSELVAESFNKTPLEKD